MSSGIVVPYNNGAAASMVKDDLKKAEKLHANTPLKAIKDQQPSDGQDLRLRVRATLLLQTRIQNLRKKLSLAPESTDADWKAALTTRPDWTVDMKKVLDLGENTDLTAEALKKQRRQLSSHFHPDVLHRILAKANCTPDKREELKKCYGDLRPFAFRQNIKLVPDITNGFATKSFAHNYE